MTGEPNQAQIRQSAQSLARHVAILADLSGLRKQTIVNQLMLAEYDEDTFALAICTYADEKWQDEQAEREEGG